MSDSDFKELLEGQRQTNALLSALIEKINQTVAAAPQAAPVALRASSTPSSASSSALALAQSAQTTVTPLSLDSRRSSAENVVGCVLDFLCHVYWFLFPACTFSVSTDGREKFKKLRESLPWRIAVICAESKSESIREAFRPVIAARQLLEGEQEQVSDADRAAAVVICEEFTTKVMKNFQNTKGAFKTASFFGELPAMGDDAIIAKFSEKCKPTGLLPADAIDLQQRFFALASSGVAKMLKSAFALHVQDLRAAGNKQTLTPEQLNDLTAKKTELAGALLETWLSVPSTTTTTSKVDGDTAVQGSSVKSPLLTDHDNDTSTAEPAPPLEDIRPKQKRRRNK
jgi:hypothetical protein